MEDETKQPRGWRGVEHPRTFVLRITQEQWETLHADAQDKGITPTTYLRQFLDRRTARRQEKTNTAPAAPSPSLSPPQPPRTPSAPSQPPSRPIPGTDPAVEEYHRLRKERLAKGK